MAALAVYDAVRVNQGAWFFYVLAAFFVLLAAFIITKERKNLAKIKRLLLQLDAGANL